MTNYEVGFYYRVCVHVQASDGEEAIEKARNLDLDVSAFSANDLDAYAEYVECIDAEILSAEEA